MYLNPENSKLVYIYEPKESQQYFDEYLFYAILS